MSAGNAGSQAGGIYVHVPFCVRKCAYCNFYSVSDKALIAAYVLALHKEIALRVADTPPDFTADTLYFGGGTPSMLNPGQIGGIIEVVRQNYALAPVAEITLEVNPATADLAKLAAYRELDVNRLSIGMQSFDDDMLALLGRAHNAAAGMALFADARRAGFDNINLDLIYGLPGQTKAQLETDISRALSLAPEHLSAYMLTLEPETPLAAMLRNGAAPPLEDDTQRAAFDTVLVRLAAAGYGQYEISNFSRGNGSGPDLRSRHNLKYWNFAPYMGFGPAAHSFMPPNRRAWNESDVATYVQRFKNGAAPREAGETLSPEQLLIERIYLGLRQNNGLELAAFDALAPRNFMTVCAEPLQKLQQADFITVQNNFCRLTAKGRPFLDYVTQLLVNAL